MKKPVLLCSSSNEPRRNRSEDRQLRSVDIDIVAEKLVRDQALTAKEFAEAAGVGYSTARSWFKMAGFPAFCGVVFWTDFVEWRRSRFNNARIQEPAEPASTSSNALRLPARAERILSEAFNCTMTGSPQVALDSGNAWPQAKHKQQNES